MTTRRSFAVACAVAIVVNLICAAILFGDRIDTATRNAAWSMTANEDDRIRTELYNRSWSPDARLQLRIARRAAALRLSPYQYMVRLTDSERTDR